MKSKTVRFLEWVNKTFPPQNSKYPAGIKSADGQVIISGDVNVIFPDFKDGGLPVIDYYGEFRGGCPWIHPLVEKKAKKMGLILEWQNPGSILVQED